MHRKGVVGQHRTAAKFGFAESPTHWGTSLNLLNSKDAPTFHAARVGDGDADPLGVLFMDGIVVYGNHPKWEQREFRLPVPSGSLPVDTPWVSSLIEKSPEEIKEQLRQRWSTVQDESVAEFCGRVLLCTPWSIVTFQERTWLLLRIAEDETTNYRNVVLISAPSKSIPKALERHSRLFLFLREFGDLSINIPVNSAGFLLGEQGNRMVHSGSEEYEWGYIGDWDGSMGVFSVGDGDLIVVSPEGRYARWDHAGGMERTAENPFHLVATSFDEFLRDFSAFLFDRADNYFA